MRLFFPIFDWLRERGLLTTEGTLLDYLVVVVAAVIISAPVVGCLILLSDIMAKIHP